MRAMVIHQFGGRDQLQPADLPTPVPGRREVLIRVHAAGVNPVDVKIREGLARTRFPHQFPIILGWDVAGVIEQVGPGATRFRVGDAVYAYARKAIVKDGAYAEYVVLPQANVALQPAGLDFSEAAAVPLAALTAWQSLFDAARLQRGQTVLIHAAAGGVGGFAVQLARWKGARVMATASAANHDYVRSLGAHEVIDYQQEDFVAAVRRAVPDGVDVAFDTVGGDVQQRSALAVGKGGVLVSILAFADEAAVRANGVVPRYVFVAPNAGQLKRLAQLAERGKLKVHLAARLPLAEAARAHEMIETRHTRGKIVLEIG